MSDTRSAAVCWPAVVELRQQVASLAASTAESRQADEGWSDEEARRHVEVVLVGMAADIGQAIFEAGVMGLDVWEVTR